MTGSSNYAIVFGTSNDDLEIQVRTGDQFDVNGQMKTILSISYSDELGPDGLPAALNGQNEFIFQMRFTDNTYGIFIATVPAPASGAALLMGLAFAGRRRR